MWSYHWFQLGLHAQCILSGVVDATLAAASLRMRVRVAAFGAHFVGLFSAPPTFCVANHQQARSSMLTTTFFAGDLLLDDRAIPMGMVLIRLRPSLRWRRWGLWGLCPVGRVPKRSATQRAMAEPAWIPEGRPQPLSLETVTQMVGDCCHHD